MELREWSRLSEELTRERARLANQMREQLWRYYPQFLDAVDDDVAAPWAVDLWRSLRTPRAGQRVREVTLTKLLKQHRIRRIDSASLRARLRVPAVRLTPGAAEAAMTHVRLVVERVALDNRQLDDVRRHLDGLVHRLTEADSTGDSDASMEDGSSPKTPPDAGILLSLPGVGTKALAALLAEGNDAVGRRDYDRLDLSGCGEKVRKLIADAVVADGIEILVKEVQLLSQEFDEKVEALATDDAKASEMEHAIRHEIKRPRGGEPGLLPIAARAAGGDHRATALGTTGCRRAAQAAQRPAGGSEGRAEPGGGNGARRLRFRHLRPAGEAASAQGEGPDRHLRRGQPGLGLAASVAPDNCLYIIDGLCHPVVRRDAGGATDLGA